MQPRPSIRFPRARIAAFTQILTGLIAVPTLVFAQAPANQAPHRLEEVVVTPATPDPDSVLPLGYSVDSIFGDKRTLFDTPRSATEVTQRQLQDAQIIRFSDLLRVSSDTFEAAQFGMPALPQIRGEDAEIFRNGIRQVGGNNGYGVPFSFNSVERLDILKGPANVVDGPTQRVGGYVNLVTKQPYFDAFHGEIGTTVGSYDEYKWHADLGGPIVPDKLAFRFSYEGENSGSYYDYIKTQTEDFFLALSMRPKEKFTLDFNAEYLNAPHYGDNSGITRPTQGLINNGSYVTGPANGVGFGSTISPAGTVGIPRSQVNTAPDDGSKAQIAIGQLTATYRFSDDLSLVNRSYFQYLDKNTQNANSFVEIIKDSYAVENRTELHWNFDLPAPYSSGLHATGDEPKGLSKDGKDTKAVITEPSVIKNQLITGFDFRFNHVLGYSEFNFEADNLIDLTAPLSSRIFPTSGLSGVVVLPGVPAHSGFKHVYVSPGGNYPTGKDAFGNVGIVGNSDSNDSNIFQYGFFLQDDIALTDKLSLLIGGRGDIIAGNVTDPIPPAGFSAQNDSTVQGEGSGSASISYKLVPWNTTYFTYNYSQSYNSALGNGLRLVNNSISASDFHIASELYEVGTKFKFFNDTAFLGLAAFHQTRNQRNAFDPANLQTTVNGLELDLSYQPAKNFYLTGNISYIDSHLNDIGGALQSTREVADAFDTSNPKVIKGTGLGSPNFFAFKPGDYRTSGLPSVVGSIFASYKLDMGLGASIGLVATNSYPLDTLGTVTIPAQYTVNAAIFYQKKNYELRVDVYNLTNQKNWAPSFGFADGGFLGSDDVYPELPVRVEGSVRIRF